MRIAQRSDQTGGHCVAGVFFQKQRKLQIFYDPQKRLLLHDSVCLQMEIVQQFRSDQQRHTVVMIRKSGIVRIVVLVEVSAGEIERLRELYTRADLLETIGLQFRIHRRDRKYRPVEIDIPEPIIKVQFVFRERFRDPEGSSQPVRVGEWKFREV